MKTLTAGSFLNLENAENVEALKHTARRLAEHTATVVKENLQPTALENLARQLWEKAEYVTRETERRRLQQIFNENFCERFRELKPEIAESQNSGFEVSPVAAEQIENADSSEASDVPEADELDKSVVAEATSENNSSSVARQESATAAQGKRDEFLGFVGTGEPFGDERAVTENTQPQETPLAAAVTNELVAEPSKPEVQIAVVETSNPVNKNAAHGDSKESANDNSSVEKTETRNIAAGSDAESKPTAMGAATAATTTSAVKPDVGTRETKEPFEFERCTINLNLTLLPAEPGTSARKVIVGAVSHNLPPEIDFLEIGCGGADLTNIAALVSDKLARFKQTLPVKYIEQLRGSKNKSAKKSAPTKTTPASAPAQPAVNQPKVEETSGEQKMPEAKGAETAKTQPETAAEKDNTAISPATMPQVNQSNAANSIQGSLF